MRPTVNIRRGVTAPRLAACVVLLAGFPAAADDWTTGVGGHASRNGLSSETGPSAASRLWTGGRSAVVSQQAVTGEGLVVMARIANFDVESGAWIVAQDLLTGGEKWAVRLPFTDPDEWRSRVSAVRDGRVYATRSGGYTTPAPLYALDVADGSILWTSDDLIDESTTESPAFAGNGDPIVGSLFTVRRFDRETGDTLWTASRVSPSDDGSAPAVFGERVYIWEGSAGGPKVTVLDARDGKRLYSSAAIGGGFVQQLGLLVGPDGTVYAPRSQNNPSTDYLVAFTDTGSALEEKWRVPIGYVPFASFCVGPDGSVYSYRTEKIGSSDAEVVIDRLDPSDGSTLNSSEPLAAEFPVQPRIAADSSGAVFFTNGGFSSGRVWCFSADLKERWSEALPGVNLGGPAIGAGGVLVVCGTGTDVRAYRSETVCRPDCNQDGKLNVNDFICFQAKWRSRDAYGDYDGSGTYTINDFIRFQAEFAKGCP